MAINLGDINFGLGPDTRRLQSAISDVLQFGRAVNQAARDQSDGARLAEAALRRQERAILSALQATLKLNDAIRATGGNNNLIQTTTNTFNRLVKELGDGRVSALQFQRSMEDFQASTGRVQRALREIERANRANTEAQNQAARASKAQEDALLRQERILFSATQAIARYNAEIAKLRNPQQLQFNPQQALQALQSAITAPGATRLDVQRAVQNFTSSLAAANAEARKLASSGLQGFLDNVAQNAILIAGPLSGIAVRLTVIAGLAEKVGAAWAAAAAGFAGAAYGLFKLSEGAIEAQKTMERIQLALTAVSGASILAQADIDYLRQVADRAGVRFADLGAQFAKLQAASKGTNLEGERTRKIFEAVVMAGAKLGSTNQEVVGTLVAIQQIMSKGTVQAEELRNQLGDRLPGAMQIMAEAMGVSTAKLSDLLKKGELGASSLVKFAEVLEKRLNIRPDDRITTTTAAENRLADAVERFNLAVDKALGISSAYKNVLNTLTQGFNFLTQNITNVIGIIGGVAGALLGLVAPQIISGFIALVNVIKAATAAMIAFNVAILANPLGGLVSLLVRLGMAAVGAVVGYELLTGAVRDGNNALQDAIPGVKAYIQAQEQLKGGIRATTQSFIDQQQGFVKSVQGQITALEQAIQKQEETVKAYQQIQQSPLQMGLMGEGILGFQVAALQAQKKLEDMRQELARLQKVAQDAGVDLSKLNDILREQQRLAEQPLTDPLKELTDRQKLAIKGAEDTIRELQQQYDNLRLPEGPVRRFAEIQLEVNKQVENFRDQLTRAQVPAETIVGLVNQYYEALKRVKEQTQSNEVEKALRRVQEQIDDAQRKMDAMSQMPGQRRFAEAWADIEKAIRGAKENMEAAGVPTDQMNQRLQQLRQTLQGLKTKELAEQLVIPLKNANDTIRETEQQLRILFTPDKMQARYLEVQNEINKSIEDFRSNLMRAGVPAGQVAELTERYGRALQALKMGRLELELHPSIFKTLADTLGRGMDTAMQQFVDGVMQGKNAMEILRDTAKMVAADILKTFLLLAAINPLKNLLFGTSFPTLGGLFGAGTGGGLLGGLLTGLFPASKGMAVTPGGFRMARGGVFASPKMFSSPAGPVLGGEAGPEALMPLARDSRGRLAVRTSGSMGPAVNVTIVTPDVQGFKKSETQVAAMFTRFVQRGSRNL